MEKYLLSFVILFCFNLGFFTIEAQQCGRGPSEFGGTSFGGVIAKKAKWPWNVAFIHRQEEKFFCGGTLISSKHVLSAAHCFHKKGIPIALSPFLVEAQLGKFNLSIENETGSEFLLVWEIVIHPDWNYKHHKFDADLAVVVLEREVTFSDFIQPICLPKQSDDYVTGTGTVVGWGKSETSGGTSAIVPSKLEVPAIDPAVCYTTHSKLARYSSNRIFCGGYDNRKKGTCHGDSGGGFYLRNKDNVWYIRGIVSGSLIAKEYGCDINKFSLFTNVAKFAEWITEVMEKTMSVDWNFVEFKCSEYDSYDIWTSCNTTFEGPMTRNLKIHTNFSSHKFKNSSIHDTRLIIDFKNATLILSGIGEEFPNLIELFVKGDTIQFIERLNFANLSQLDILEIRKTSVEFWPEDLLVDLPNLITLQIISNRQLELLPKKLFKNQGKLEVLSLYNNGLTILQKDLFKNNLGLERLYLDGNNLIEIYVDFTRLPAVRLINLMNNQCINQVWKAKDKSIKSFQNKIGCNCPPRVCLSAWNTFVSWLT